MNEKHRHYVLALSETLNFSQAAEQLGISQPSLSKQIQQLEKELGVQLFDRKHTPLTLTPAGEYFVRKAKDMLYQEEQLRKTIRQFQSGETGRLVIGATPFRSLYLVPDLVKKLRMRYPGISVCVREISSPLLRKEAAEGKFDLAIVNLPVDTALLDTVPLEADTLVLAVHKSMTGNLPQTGDGAYATIDFSQAKDLPFVVLSPGQELRVLFEGMCNAAAIRPTIAAEVIGVATAWAMARAGVGAALLPLQFVHSPYLNDDLALYVIRNDLYSRQPVIAVRRDQPRPPYVDYAIRLLTE